MDSIASASTPKALSVTAIENNLNEAENLRNPPLEKREMAQWAKALQSLIGHSTTGHWRYLTCLEWALGLLVFYLDGMKHMEGILQVENETTYVLCLLLGCNSLF